MRQPEGIGSINQSFEHGALASPRILERQSFNAFSSHWHIGIVFEIPNVTHFLYLFASVCVCVHRFCALL